MWMVNEVKDLSFTKFEMKNLGEVDYCFDIEVKRNESSKRIWLGQLKYIFEFLLRFGT